MFSACTVTSLYYGERISFSESLYRTNAATLPKCAAPEGIR